jgi:hypothetical protein
VKFGALILDSNLSVLLVVGLANKAWIAQHKRLQEFDAADFDILANVVDQSTAIWLSPNVLSETANLVRQIKEPHRSAIMIKLAEVIDIAEEKYVESRSAKNRTEFVRLGLTDAVILEMASPDATILTADVELYLAAQSAGFTSLNFNHWKNERSDYQV